MQMSQRLQQTTQEPRLWDDSTGSPGNVEAETQPLRLGKLDASCSQEGGITLSWVDLFGHRQSYGGMQLRAINYQ